MKKVHLSFMTFLALSSSIILSGCGGGNSSVKKTFAVDALLADERPLNNDERNVAARICYAYQSKSTNFRGSNFLGTQFIFSAKKTDCQGLVSSYQVPTTLQYNDSNNLIYQTPSNFNPNLKFNNVVQTDSFGFLSQLCSKIKNNEPINNTTLMNTVKVQISFFREGLDGFMLQYFNKQTDNTYKIDSAEKFKVRTQLDFTTGQILGMDEFYSTQKVCLSTFDKNTFSDFEQAFTSR
ncbi:MAG: hypothetical protein ACXVLQ_17835 [Bacteriovorax sp.]